MRYGLPYKGSKNSIAKWIVDQLPKADTFCDLFFGGGAITHRALLSGKYKKFIANDIDARLPKLFLECAHGEHTIERHPEWISRQEFNEKKDSDAYIALVWSFGNNGKDYIYGADLEDFKRDYHIAVFQDRPDILKKWGYEITSSHKDKPYDRYLEFNRQIKSIARSDLDSIVRQIEIERLQSLQSVRSVGNLQSFQYYGIDYQEVPIPKGALIYCDIPYNSTNCGKYQGFDHQRFYDWAEQQDNIFISEYSMPENFIPYAQIEKSVLSAQGGNDKKANEILFTNERTFNKLSSEQKELSQINFSKQLSFFDL